MKLEEQVTNLELSKKLKELGVKQESLFYWVGVFPLVTSKPIIVNAEKLKEFYSDKTEDFIRAIKNEVCSAFTVAELGEMLPDQISSHKYNKGWVCGEYMNNQDWDNYEVFGTEVNARAKCLIYLIENEIIKPNEDISVSGNSYSGKSSLGKTK